MKDDPYEKLAIEFETGLYELGRELYPKNRRVLDGLVSTYSAAGRHADSLAAASRLLEMHPDNPRYQYNYACCLCCNDQKEEALEALKKAIDMGFDDFDYLTKDEDLVPLKDCPEFREWQKRALVQRSQRHRKVE